jgi:peptidoglycan/xylan/chitin deacetylase (PgdA/CDA1 family)
MGRARRGFRAARNLLAPHGVILMYHRIAEVEHDPWSLCVTRAHFAEQLDVLSRRATVVPLPRLFEAIPSSSRRRPPVAITFDDGYADNLHVAKPLLERHDMPATLFVATGYTGSGRAYWSDQLVRIVLGTPTLPTRLSLTIDGAPFEREIDGRERRTLLFDLWQRLRPLPIEEQMRLLDALRQWAGCRDSPDRAALPMSHEEVRSIAEDGLIEIGAHTVSHCDLPACSASRQMSEIERSKADCEAITGRHVTSFAYPYGRFNDTSADCVNTAGFSRACTTRPDLSFARSDRFRLPRLGAQDWDGDEFERRFRGRFDVISFSRRNST